MWFLLTVLSIWDSECDQVPKPENHLVYTISDNTLEQESRIPCTSKPESPNREYGQQNHILLFSSTAEILLMYFGHATYPESY